MSDRYLAAVHEAKKVSDILNTKKGRDSFNVSSAHMFALLLLDLRP